MLKRWHYSTVERAAATGRDTNGRDGIEEVIDIFAWMMGQPASQCVIRTISASFHTSLAMIMTIFIQDKTKWPPDFFKPGSF